MMEAEILTEAIRKAQDNGFKTEIKLYITDLLTLDEWQAIIFSHDFAKAFWGEAKHIAGTDQDDGEYECRNCGSRYGQENEFCWEVYLQQMVVKKEPIRYLEKFLSV